MNLRTFFNNFIYVIHGLCTVLKLLFVDMLEDAQLAQPHDHFAVL